MVALKSYIQNVFPYVLTMIRKIYIYIYIICCSRAKDKRARPIFSKVVTGNRSLTPPEVKGTITSSFRLV